MSVDALAKNFGLDRRSFRRALAISFSLHAVLILSFVMGSISWGRKRWVDLDQPVIWAELKVGESRTGSAMPKLTQPEVPKLAVPKPEAPSKPAEVVRDDFTKSKPSKTNELSEAEENARRRQAMQAALSGVKSQVPTPGTTAETKPSQGAVGVTASEFFKNQVKRKIIQNLFVTDYDWFSVYRDRIVEYNVRLAPSGDIVEVKLVRSSGVSSMDQAVLQAIKKAEPFKAPSDDMQALFVREGMRVRFSPQDVER